jgi:hypothetical protein
LKVGGFSNPQWEQRLAKGAAQLPQNFMPSGFSNPHFEQDCTLPNLFGFPVAHEIRRVTVPSWHYSQSPPLLTKQSPQG